MSSWWDSAIKTGTWLSKSIQGETCGFLSVVDESETKPYTLATRDDFKWQMREESCVETQTFYVFSKLGHVVMVQVIYSNTHNTVITCQLSTKIFYPKDAEGKTKDAFWRSHSLSDYTFSEDKTNFNSTDGNGSSIVLNEAGTGFVVKTDAYGDETVCEIEVTRVGETGFKVGADGKSIYGDDPEKPDGFMRHVFWPRCQVTGSITTKEDGKLDVAGSGVFIHALQGMLPNYIASKWNFITCQTPTHSAIQMEFTTPAYYKAKTVTVGGIVTDDGILVAGGNPAFEHTSSEVDPDTNWPAPTAMKVQWAGKTSDDKPVSATLEGSLGPLAARIDVFQELPPFAKQIMSSLLGTSPFVYQYHHTIPFTLTVGDAEPTTQEGLVFSEASFIS